MKVVSIEWFEQSLERGMALEESYFLPTLPVSERGKGAWEQRQRVSPTLGKRTRDAEQAPIPDPTRRKLRRSASAKFGSQSEALWAGITAVSQRQATEEDEWTEDSILRPGPTESVKADDAASADPAGGQTEPEPEFRSLPAREGFFDGRAIFALGFDAEKVCDVLRIRVLDPPTDPVNQMKILREVLTTNGAAIIETATGLARLAPHDLTRGFVVVPQDARTNALALPEAAEAMTLTTNWWVEQCLFAKALVDPTGRALCKPFGQAPVDGVYSLMNRTTA